MSIRSHPPQPARARGIVPGIYLSAATLAALLALAWAHQIDVDTERLALERGRMLTQLIEVTRNWNSAHGGVYVPVTPETQPNPYLLHPKRDLVDNYGRQLTLLNPAYMTRQIATLASREDGLHFHLTSLQPLRPENAADAWEQESLRMFLRDRVTERLSYFAGTRPTHRYMMQLTIVPSCLVCHAAQGYKLGDQRGGISVVMPATALVTVAAGQKRLGFLCIGAGALLLAALGHFIAWRTKRHLTDVHRFNSELEGRVRERTREVQNLYDHERYLRELLGIVTRISDSLLSQLSPGSIIESSIRVLAGHDNYRLVVFAYYDGQACSIRHVSGDRYQLIDREYYRLDELAQHPLLRAMAVAIESRCQAQWDVVDHPPPVRLRAEDYDLSAAVCLPLIEQNDDVAYNLLTVCTDRPGGFDAEELRILETLASDLTMAFSANKQRQLSESLYQENLQNYEETILAFVSMIEHRDAYTAGHTLRVADYCRRIAQAIGLSDERIRLLEQAAVLHDIGKVATPDTILLKPGRLSQLEYNLIKMHVEVGYRMLSGVKMYGELAEIMRYHHEHHDGGGYPYGISGNEIPIESRILIVADAFDAMTTNRIYRARLSAEEALNEIASHAGTQFNPEIASVAIESLRGIHTPEAAQLPDSDLEHQRFSYFFSDTLTGLYNLTYLQVVLARGADLQWACVLELRKFSQFNKRFGWHVGDDLLKAVASQLSLRLPDALLFRFEGDDFLIVCAEAPNIDLTMLDLPMLNDPPGCELVSRCFSLQNPAERRALLELLGISEAS